MFKAIIIGCGKIAGYFDGHESYSLNSHAASYANLSGISVVDYIDINLEKAKKIAKKFHCQSFGTDFISSINKNKPDVVSICTPDNTHFSIAKRILTNKIVPKVIFMEKPACSNMEEFAYLKMASRKHKVVFIVNHSRRFHDAYIKLRGLIQKNVFGTPVRIDIFYYGGFKHNGVHVIDTLLFLFNDKLKCNGVRGRIQTQYKTDPTLDLSFVLSRSGAIVYLHAFDEKNYQLFDLDLKFDNARLRIENFESKFIFEKKNVNSKGENILINAKLDLLPVSSSPMENAMKIILKYLKTNDFSFIRQYSLDQAEDTMQTIAQVGEIK